MPDRLRPLLRLVEHSDVENDRGKIFTMDTEILEVLKEIRDEAKQTNARLESLEGRVEFLETRTSRGFQSLNERLETHVERLELLARQQAQSEIRLATEVLSLADVTRDVRDLLSRKLDDHHLVMDHEERLRTLESRLDAKA